MRIGFIDSGVGGLSILSAVRKQVNADYIYVMDRSNYDHVKELAGEKFDSEQVRLLLNEVYTGENQEVPDPWSYGIDAYQDVYTMLEQACECLIQKLVSDNKKNTHS